VAYKLMINSVIGGLYYSSGITIYQFGLFCAVLRNMIRIICIIRFSSHSA